MMAQRISPLFHPAVECRSYHDLILNSTQLCTFMNSTENCHLDDGFIDYLIFSFCSFDKTQTWIPLILLGLWAIVLFISLALVADAFFCPSLRTIADSMKLSQNIAGVTFLAFGNGAPDVFSAIAAISNIKDGDAGLALGALFGAGVFISTIIVGVICFIKPFYSVQRPMLRDIIFFIIAGFWTFYVIWDGKISLWETLGFLILYVVYVFVVVIGRFINQKIKLKKGIVTKNDFSSKKTRTEKVVNANDTYNGEDDRGDNENDDEISEITRPLLGDKIDDEYDVESSEKFSQTNYPKSLKNTCLPFELIEWTKSNIFNKLIILIKAPVYYLLKLTIPLVDYDIEKNNWNKVTIISNCLISPTLMVFATKVYSNKLFNLFPVWSVSLLVGVILALLVIIFTDINKPPKFHWVFAYLGFCVSIIWIYTIANEIVNLLTTFGVILNISNTILGLTLLAWGNSLSDLVADAATARRGFPNMAISACYGGPLFNILIGIGIPFTIKCFSVDSVLINKSFLQDVLALFLAISLVSSLIFIPLNNFYFSRKFGVYLILLYAVFLVVCILIETKILTNPF